MDIVAIKQPWSRRDHYEKWNYENKQWPIGADKIDWSRALIDSATTKAPGGGEKTGSNQTDFR